MWSLGRDYEMHCICNTLHMVVNLKYYKKQKKSRENLHIYMYVNVIN